MRGLRALGVRVALGGGSASSLPLNQISEVQPDQVTVDLAAVRAAHGSERSVALLACLIKTGQVLRLFVEKESEADCARACGAAEIRGPWVSPVMADVSVLVGDGEAGEARLSASA
ncbi:EAL domain-containing protein [Ensifer sp. OV372]|nr:EAL domain-containing protein [Ensifer sp. OV372]